MVVWDHNPPSYKYYYCRVLFVYLTSLVSRDGNSGPYDTNNSRAYFYLHLAVHDSITLAYYAIPYVNNLCPHHLGHYTFSFGQAYEEYQNCRHDDLCGYIAEINPAANKKCKQYRSLLL